jgi:hypothetical protein
MRLAVTVNTMTDNGRPCAATTTPAAVARDAAARFVTLDRALAPIRRLLAHRPGL